MASAWGSAWGAAWGDAWGALAVPQTFGGSWFRWRKRLAGLTEETRGELEQIVQQAVQTAKPAPQVKRAVQAALRRSSVEQDRRAAYAEAVLEFLALRQQEQEEEDEAISILLMH